MRSFYFILILVIAAFMFLGLYYVRLEMSRPGYVGRIERAERDLAERPRSGDSPPAVSSGSLAPAPSPPPKAAPPPNVETAKAPEPPVMNTAPKVDLTYRLIDRIYKEPMQVRSPTLDFFNRETYITIPGTLHLAFEGVSTEIKYPVIEAKFSMADLFTVGAVYTREQINAAKK